MGAAARGIGRLMAVADTDIGWIGCAERRPMPSALMPNGSACGIVSRREGEDGERGVRS